MVSKIFISLMSLITVGFSAWGSDPSAGAFSNDVWTPGRDGNGIVNQASWDLVPTNRWIQVSSTRLDAMDAVVKAAVPGWRDRGNEGWNSITNDWNGMAWDERTGSERGWIAVSGGHNGGSNDGIYQFNLRKMQWLIQRMPQDNSWWPASYNSFYTSFQPANDYYTNNPSNPEGVFYDEFFDSTNLAKSSRTPTARHTYGSCVFAPSLGDSGKILMGCRRYWEYDIASNTWSRPKFPFGNQVGYTAAAGLGYTGECMEGWWNEAEGRYYVASTQDYGASQTWSVLAGGTEFRWEGWYPTGGWNSTFMAQERIGRKLYSLLYTDYGATGKPASMIITDLDTRAQTSHAVVLDSELSTMSFYNPNFGFYGQAMTFVPEEGKWFCNAYTPLGFKWCWLDTLTWTLSIADIQGSYPAAVCNEVETKVKYLPDLHAIVWINTADQNITLIKFSSVNTSLEKKKGLPFKASLCSAPEPFNPETRITYELPSSAKVSLSVLDASGRIVSVLESGNREAGSHSVTWNSIGAGAVASGHYFARLEALDRNGGKTVVTKRMVLLR